MHLEGMERKYTGNNDFKYSIENEEKKSYHDFFLSQKVVLYEYIIKLI